MARTRHGRGSGCWCGVGVEMCRYGCVERGGCECVRRRAESSLQDCKIK